MEKYTINSEKSLFDFFEKVRVLFYEHKHITFSKPRIGESRSLSQNALFHVWCTEYAAFCTGVDKKNIDYGVLSGMKRISKRYFLLDNPHCSKWMTMDIVNPFTNEAKKDYTSSASWKSGEMFMFLEWLQNHAAKNGLILESKGEFASKQRRQQA